MSTQAIPEFEYKPEKYALHNARPEPVDFMWAGLRFTIPPCDVLGTKPSMLDDGTPLPGTLLIEDAYAMDASNIIPNSGPHNWKAKEAIRAVLGIQPGSNQALSPYAINGISYLPLGCSRDTYEAIKTGGLVRYRASLVGWAMDTVQNYEEARAKAKQSGVDTRPPGPDFYRAQAILKAHEKSVQTKVMEEIAVEAEVEDDELEFIAYAKKVALQLAEKVTDENSVDKALLAEKMLQDPKVAAKFRRKYRLRKIGYMDPNEAPEAEQPVPE